MRVVKCALLASAIVVCSLVPVFGQTPPNGNLPAVSGRTQPITSLGWYVMGSIGCAAVSPIIGTVILGRELTISEVYHTTLGCTLGPVGWLLADALFPPTVTGPNTRVGTQSRKSGQVARGRHFTIPPPGDTRFVSNEVLFEFSNGASAQARGALVRSLQLTQLEAQSFALTGRTIERWRIDGTRTVRDTLRLVARNFPSVVSGQANGIYLCAQAQPTTKQDAAADGELRNTLSASYIFWRLTASAAATMCWSL